MHGAGATGGDAAAVFGTGQTNIISQDPQQRDVVGQVDLMGFSIDAKGSRHGDVLSGCAAY